jgi:hypothetical protein
MSVWVRVGWRLAAWRRSARAHAAPRFGPAAPRCSPRYPRRSGWLDVTGSSAATGRPARSRDFCGQTSSLETTKKTATMGSTTRSRPLLLMRMGRSPVRSRRRQEAQTRRRSQLPSDGGLSPGAPPVRQSFRTPGWSNRLGRSARPTRRAGTPPWVSTSSIAPRQRMRPPARQWLLQPRPTGGLCVDGSRLVPQLPRMQTHCQRRPGIPTAR